MNWVETNCSESWNWGYRGKEIVDNKCYPVIFCSWKKRQHSDRNRSKHDEKNEYEYDITTKGDKGW